MKPLLGFKDLAVTQAVVAALFFFSIPLFNLMGLSSHKTQSVLHGLGASFTVAFSCYTLHQIYPLLRNKAGAALKLERMLWITNGLVLLTIVFGNWLYISYRAPDGVQQWLLYHKPAGHTVLMEFKEIFSLYSLPLGVTAAFLLRRFRRGLQENSALLSIVALLVTVMWISLIAGMAFGLGLSKLKIV